MEYIDFAFKNYEVEGELFKERRRIILKEIERSTLCETVTPVVDTVEDIISNFIPSIEELRAEEKELEPFKNLVLKDDVTPPTNNDDLLKESFSYLIFTDVENNLAIIAYNIMVKDVSGELIETRGGELEKLVIEVMEEIGSDFTIESCWGITKNSFYNEVLKRYTN